MEKDGLDFLSFPTIAPVRVSVHSSLVKKLRFFRHLAAVIMIRSGQSRHYELTDYEINYPWD